MLKKSVNNFNPVRRYILTGTPGCGKTSVIKSLEAKHQRVIHEAATDIISSDQKMGNMEPWKNSDFIDRIIEVQKERQLNAGSLGPQFYDRSPICTFALSLYLNFSPSTLLQNEIDRILNEEIYQKPVFFLKNFGFIQNTDARKISYEEALRFEQCHLDAYKKFGYNVVMIEILPVEERSDLIMGIIRLTPP
jgi:predicted ATPase